MSAYSAFVSLRRYLDNYPTAPVNSAVEVLRRINSESSGLDYPGAMLLHHRVPMEMRLDHRYGLRTVIKELVEAAQPWWLRLVPYGREKVRAALGQDQAQCFRDAGLFDLLPDEGVVSWWDELASTVRGLADTERVANGREAERLSFEHERERLKRLKIDGEPSWVALEDNTLGYDIRSYDRVDGRVVNTLIEVKSAASDVIFITRNEWNNAVSAGGRYVFHIWRMPKAELMEVPVTGIDPHIPADRGDGLWQDVKISLSP